MIRFEHVDFTYPGGDSKVLSDLCLDIKDGEFLCVIGHSGCGKSTLLRLAAGLDRPQTGKIYIDEKELAGPSADRTIVFQQYSLFPWMTVKKNVLFAMKKTGRFSKEEMEQRAVYFLEKAGLSDAADKYPYQLSGGMRQRTAIARALAMDSPFLLLDEPFGALDTKIRKELQQLLHQLWENGEEKKTVIFVTHDLEEAMLMASRIVFIKDGKVAQEKYIDSQINSCCCDELGQVDCLSLKAELARWYE
ncbi:ABC transporter ATP-binding protein [Anaerotruncus sp. 80]|uniref:ABC transporter ATP-binding protein n=1 Tax=Anaerotruncus colihominis TaxID=169435 RepID=A0A845QHW7_9FIRM|nr:MULTISPECIES: ABC transporter ATP-binding protein [Anaerotruncus]NBH60353.1 ABC transporter ATP-binding protein [Anaerotruncus colihominis]NCF01007.1 ABC transporter ATP-binding protein [Anaerotruncus sp. 80]